MPYKESLTIAPYKEIEISGVPYSLEVLPPGALDTQHLDLLRALSYAQYRAGNQPQCITPAHPSNINTLTYYIVAHSPNLLERYRANPPRNGSCPPEIAAQAIELFPTTAGFYKLQFGKIKESDNGLVIPIEADGLIHWDGWQPGEYVGYISSFSFNPLTSLPDRLSAAEAIHTLGSQVAHQMNGGLNRILAIMTPKVARFLRQTGADMKELGGTLRWRDESGNLTQVAQHVFNQYPGYWGTETTPEADRPILWEVSKGFPHKEELS